MPNVALTKSDGLTLNLPANSITGIFSTALDQRSENMPPNGRCVIFSNFKGMSVYVLAHPAKDVLEQIKASLGRSKPQDFVILSAGDDISAIQAESVDGFEQVKRPAPAAPEGDKKAEPEADGTLLLVHFKRHTGEPSQQLADDTPENNERLIALAKEED